METRERETIDCDVCGRARVTLLRVCARALIHCQQNIITVIHLSTVYTQNNN